MVRKMRRALLPLCCIALVAGCGGGSNGGGGGGNDQQALVDEIAARFPYQPNQPLDQIFVCAIAGSVLTWYLDFQAAGVIDLYTTLDTGQDIFDSGGTYTHQNNRLEISMVNNAVNLPNEVSIRIETGLGLVTRFTTANLDCATFGHRYNAAEFASVVHFQCPISNIQAVSEDENAVEFVHSAMPFSLPVPGSAFRQRDRHVSGAINPLIRRGYGLYRRDGNRIYAWFGANQFDDYAYLSGRLDNANSSLTLDQADVARAACPRT